MHSNAGSAVRGGEGVQEFQGGGGGGGGEMIIITVEIRF